jgi:hypothetical protein
MATGFRDPQFRVFPFQLDKSRVEMTAKDVRLPELLALLRAKQQT